jgi:phosphate transport system substrate-binding protein
MNVPQPLYCLPGPWRGIVVAVALLLCAVPGIAGADELRIGGTGAALGTMQLLGEAFGARHPDIKIRIVPSLGSAGGIQAIASAAIDLAVTSRPLKQDELKLGTSELEYGRTPFVFAVNMKSRITETTLAQLAKIYAGEQVKWPDGSVIRPVLRPASDIDSEMVRNLSPEIGQAHALAMKRPGVRISNTDQEAAEDLEKIAGAIGPTTLSLILTEDRKLRALKIDGKEPTAKNLASGAYPYFKRLFLVMGNQRPAAAHLFIAFVLSPAGHKVLAEHGHWVP